MQQNAKQELQVILSKYLYWIYFDLTVNQVKPFKMKEYQMQFQRNASDSTNQGFANFQENITQFINDFERKSNQVPVTQAIFIGMLADSIYTDQSIQTFKQKLTILQMTLIHINGEIYKCILNEKFIQQSLKLKHQSQLYQLVYQVVLYSQKYMQYSLKNDVEMPLKPRALEEIQNFKSSHPAVTGAKTVDKNMALAETLKSQVRVLEKELLKEQKKSMKLQQKMQLMQEKNKHIFQQVQSRMKVIQSINQQQHKHHLLKQKEFEKLIELHVSKSNNTANPEKSKESNDSIYSSKEKVKSVELQLESQILSENDQNSDDECIDDYKSSKSHLSEGVFDEINNQSEGYEDDDISELCNAEQSTRKLQVEVDEKIQLQNDKICVLDQEMDHSIFINNLPQEISKFNQSLISD